MRGLQSALYPVLVLLVGFVAACAWQGLVCLVLGPVAETGAVGVVLGGFLAPIWLEAGP